MASSSPTAAGIDQKLRDDFRRRLKDFGIAVDAADPVLAVLFRTFARQLETLYADTDGIRLSLLDELIDGLGIVNRVARPAQTIIRFEPVRNNQYLAAGTALAGETDLGDKVVFATDAGVMVSSARIAMAATYQDGRLQLMGGIDMPDDLRSARASFDPVAVELGGCPAIFLAIEDLPESHLTRHSLFFEINPESPGIARASRTESWCLAAANGVFEAKGVLRPRRANAGVRALEWLIEESPDGVAAPPGESKPLALPDGFYSGRCFVFPEVAPGRRFLCRCPRAMEPAFGRMFGSQSFLSKERAWIRISMPMGIGNLHTALTSITLHAISASNVECFNQTVYFEKHGASAPVSKQAGTSSYLVAPLSIFGECGSEYLPKFQPSFDAGAGRYSLHNGRIILTPARSSDDRLDTYVNLRLWVTTGARANKVGAGKVQVFVTPAAAGLRIGNLTAAAGGTDEEEYSEARARFAEAVLSRDRLVTRADLITALRAFDRRVLGAELAAGLHRGVHGLQRVQRITLHLNRGDFIDPSEESRVLIDEIKSYLANRFLYDMELAIDVEWK